jgi:hypothetical protein
MPTLLTALGLSKPIQWHSSSIWEIFDRFTLDSGSSSMENIQLWRYEEEAGLDWQLSCLQEFRLDESWVPGQWDLATFVIGLVLGMVGSITGGLLLLVIYRLMRRNLRIHFDYPSSRQPMFSTPMKSGF